MFFISVTSLTEKENASGAAISGIRIRRSDLAVDAAVSSPYGFAFEDGNFFVAGESIGRIDDHQIRSEIRRALADPDGKTMPPSNLLSLVAVDFSRGETIALSNVSSCRPLYYHIETGRAMFSSHIRKFREAGLRLRLNDNILAEVLVYRFVTPPATLIDGVSELAGGQRLRLDKTAPNGFRTSMWPFPSRSRSDEDKTPPVERCRQILSDNIGSVLDSYKKPGVLLSGGLDSSLVAALAVQTQPDTNSISSSFSFLNPADQETGYATSIAESLGMDHAVHAGTEEGYLRSLVHAVYAAEEPVHHLQSVMLHLLFEEEGSRSNDVLLCGEAADGLFGNDSHQKLFKYRTALAALGIPGVRHLSKPLMKLLGRKDPRFDYFSRQFDRNQSSDDHLLWSLGQFTPPELVREYFGTSTDSITDRRRALMEPYAGRSLLDQISIITLLCEGFKTMTIWSKLAESSGLALHYPFPDRDLIAHILSVPWETKLQEPKHIVRQILRDSGIREQFITRPKRSFGFPPQYWALPDTLLQPVVDMAADLFGDETLQRLQTGDMGKAMALWTSINVFLVKKLIVDGTDPNALADEVLQRHRSRKEG